MDSFGRACRVAGIGWLLAVAAAGLAAKPPVIISGEGYRLQLDADRGSIDSLSARYGEDTDLLTAEHGKLPLLKLEFLIAPGRFRVVTSAEAKRVAVSDRQDGQARVVTFRFEQMAGLPVSATATVRCPSGESLTYWSLEIDNRTSYWIGHVQFPVVEVPFDRSPTDDTMSYILSSLYDGMLVGPVRPGMIGGSWRRPRHDTADTWRSTNYPRECTTQLMAYYNPRGGLYVACADPAGLPKLLAPLLESDGVTMGLGHYPGTRGPSTYHLPYAVVLGTFHGDWYAAADLYRAWAERQAFCGPKLADRRDLPAWLLQPMVGVEFPLRGHTDADPSVSLNPEYAPAPHALPYLAKLADAVDASLMPVPFNWEQAGPWVQPEAFPPVGGAASFRTFMAEAKARGWHPALYGDGLNWVVGQRATGYHGMAAFTARGGEHATVRTWNGNPMIADTWRKYYVACVGTAAGQQMVVAMTRGMADLGADVIQQFDQGCGPVACYAADHGHPPVPGPWMTEDFERLLDQDRAAAQADNPAVVMSSEGAPPEIFLRHFQLWDSRIGGGGRLSVPLYAFIYHEYLNGHAGAYLNAVNDEALRDASARALVNGYLQNYTLRDQGRIEFDWDLPWDRAVPDQAGILDWTCREVRFRAGAAHDYLTFGRMLPPWRMTGVAGRDFGYGQEPLVLTSTWRAPDGRLGTVLANYSDSTQAPHLEIPGHGEQHLRIDVDGVVATVTRTLPATFDLKMPPRSLGLVEVRP